MSESLTDWELVCVAHLLPEKIRILSQQERDSRIDRMTAIHKHASLDQQIQFRHSISVNMRRDGSTC